MMKVEVKICSAPSSSALRPVLFYIFSNSDSLEEKQDFLFSILFF